MPPQQHGRRGDTGPQIAPGVTTVGVRRSALAATTNNFAVTIPKATIYHYDVEITGTKKMPTKFNLDLIRILQEHVAPNIFTPRVVYDGRKNIFGSHKLNLPGDTQTFDVTMSPPQEGGRPPKVYQVTLKKVAEINPTLLERYQRGQQSYDNMVSTALTAVNVTVAQEPV
ncbi:hypothetical protein BDV93DRAFT_285950 [Ceratobasidium sp. AG-I]|nr:hypothetical protein BDV93DRAFT_285950 [Ceratobasidium sp. AG-I]